MAISKSAVRKSAYHRQPMSTINDGVKTMWYTQRNIDENARKYVRLHPEDKQYVFNTLQRFLADFSQLQYIKPELCRMFYESRTECGPMGKEYQKITGSKYNSINSLVAGLLSNYYRNPDVDFTQKQLKQIEYLFTVIVACYRIDPFAFRIGYTKNGVDNEMPLEVKFRSA